ncbi:MAG: VacJ family lipoprotein [Pseudomonadota bacterium]
MSIKHLFVLLTTLGMFACASHPEQQISAETNNGIEQETTQVTAGVSDPLEGVNRVIWDFNYDILDKFILKPVTQGYVAVTPQPVRTGLLNFSENLEEPFNLVNNLLEGSFHQSAVNFSRFVINTTVGVLGIFDVASTMDLEPAQEDLGQVLGIWGLGTGPYLMLPVLGPSEVRDTTGMIVEGIATSNIYSDPLSIGGTVIGLLESRAAVLGQEETLERALDQYLFVRDAYFQRLAFELNDGQLDETSEDEILQDDEDFSEFEDLLNGI